MFSLSIGNGKSQNKSAAAFIAPDRPGFYLLTLTAEKNGIEDVIERSIEVVPYFNSIQVISPYPHPHVGSCFNSVLASFQESK